MKKTAILLCILAMAVQAYAEENAGTNYQRYDLTERDLELTVEGSFKYWFENINDKTVYTLNPNIALDFGFLQKHSVKADFGYTMSILDSYQTANRFFYAPNDITITYKYLKKIDFINIFFGPQCTIPLGENNEYSAREGILSAGYGRYMPGGVVTITGIRDPVVWNGEFSYKVGLPKEERFGTSWLPGIMTLSAGLSDLVNDRFGFSFALQQNMVLPEIKNGVTVPDSFTYSGSFQLEVFVLFEHDYVRTGLVIPVFPNDRPYTVALTYGHVFKKKK